MVCLPVPDCRYPVDVNVLHSICNPYGTVLRIVIMRRRGVQALIEFEDVGAASRAKDALHNQDIYAGCNTLKVEFSTSERVNVRYNTEDMFDYTGANQQGQPPQRSNSFSQQQQQFPGAIPSPIPLNVVFSTLYTRCRAFLKHRRLLA